MEENLNSNEYLEMANHAKELVEDAERKVNSLKIENTDLKKELLGIYGSIRMLDNMIDGSCPEEIVLFSEIIRGYLSNIITCYII